MCVYIGLLTRITVLVPYVTMDLYGYILLMLHVY